MKHKILTAISCFSCFTFFFLIPLRLHCYRRHIIFFAKYPQFKKKILLSILLQSNPKFIFDNSSIIVSKPDNYIEITSNERRPEQHHFNKQKF